MGLAAALLFIFNPGDDRVSLVVVLQVKTNAANNVCGQTFYVMAAKGEAPQRSSVEAACDLVGGQLVEEGEDPQKSGAPISISLLGHQWHNDWNGTATSPDSASAFSTST